MSTLQDMTEPESEEHRSVAGRLLNLLEHLVLSEDGLGVRDTARTTGIDKSAISRILTQLVKLDYVAQEPTSGRFVVGPRLFALGAAIVARDSIVRAATPILERLTEQFNETSYLAVREGDAFTYRAKVECTRPIRYVMDIGYVGPLHAGAPGRAILSGMPDDELTRTLDKLELTRHTELTVTDRKALLKGVADDRDRGYSLTVGERMKGGMAAAAPFYDSIETCRGAVVLSMPADRYDPKDLPRLATAITHAAIEMTARLGKLR